MRMEKGTSCQVIGGGVGKGGRTMVLGLWPGDQVVGNVYLFLQKGHLHTQPTDGMQCWEPRGSTHPWDRTVADTFSLFSHSAHTCVPGPVLGKAGTQSWSFSGLPVGKTRYDTGTSSHGDQGWGTGRPREQKSPKQQLEVGRNQGEKVPGPPRAAKENTPALCCQGFAAALTRQ